MKGLIKNGVAIFFLFQSLVGLVFAQIGVVPDIIDFTADQPPAQNVLVQNVGKQDAFVNVTPYVVENPGTKNEKEVRVYDPAKSGILVDPTRLIVPPGQQRYVRIMLTNPLGKTDRIYRVNFVPEIAGLRSTQKIKGKEIGLDIIIGYGILITARPNNLMPNIKFARSGSHLTMKNIGNTNIMVTATQCSLTKQCKTIYGNRLYAGNQASINLPYSTPVKVETNYLDNIKFYTF